MTHERFSRLVRNWVYRVRRPARRTTDAARNLVRLAVNECESRIAPAALPGPVVTESRVIADATVITDPLGTPNTFVTGKVNADNPDFERYGTQAAIHPADPNRMVVASSRPDGVVLQFSANGGVTWTTLLSTSENLLNTAAVNTIADPLTDSRFVSASSPSVALGYDGHIYMVHLIHNADKSVGQVVFNSWSWAPGSAPAQIANYTNIYHWAGLDRAENPVVAAPTFPASYTDPETGVTITNSMVNTDPAVDVVGAPKGVYVAWNTVATTPSANEIGGTNPNSWFNPNAILTASTQDRGLTFSSPVFVNRLGYWGSNVSPTALRADASFAPRIAFGPTGKVTFAWESRNTNDPLNTATPELYPFPLGAPVSKNTGDAQLVFDTSTPGFNKDLAVFNKRNSDGATGGIGNANYQFDANGNKVQPDLPTTTFFPLDIPTGYFTDNWDKLTDLDVGIALRHGRLNEINIQLIAPDGTTVTLLTNRTDAGGTNDASTAPFPLGLPGGNGTTKTGIGIATNKGTLGFAVFDDNAPRRINDPNGTQAANGYIGFFRPNNSSLAILNGRTADKLEGTWKLAITDFRITGNENDTAPQALADWYLNFTSYQVSDGFGMSSNSGFNSKAESIVAVPTGNKDQFNLLSSSDPTNTFKPNFSPNVAVGPSISIAYDNSVGPLATTDRLYVAYTALDKAGGTDTDIRLASSDNGTAFTFANLRENPNVPGNSSTSIFPYDIGRVNDDNMFDHTTEGNRPQIMPSVAVDPVSGHVTVMWYDARNDASGTRFEVFMATSMDGGATFSPQVPVTPPKTARDTITNTQVTLETTTINVGTFGTNGLGTFAGTVLAYGGKITPFWSGNYNDDKNFVFTASARVPAGPQIIAGDMGPVTEAITVPGTTFTYNNTFKADGTRQLDGFTVTFDRPVDPRTFDKTDVVVQFRRPDDNTFSDVSVKEVIPVNGNTKANLSGQAVFVDATTYFARFDSPQSEVGTYSYTVGPDIRDFSRAIDGVELLRPTGAFAAPFTKVETLTTSGGTSTIAVPAGVVGAVSVEVTIDTPGAGSVILMAPDGVTQVGLAGGTFVRSRFDPASTNDVRTDPDAFTTRAIYNPQLGPYTGTFRPVGDLNQFAGLNAGGTWKLIVNGKFVNPARVEWSLNITPGQKNTPASPAIGSPMDQDGDARPQETAALSPTSNDQFSVPRPTTGTPFTLPYVSTTLPLIIPGPHVRPDTAAEDNVTVSGQDANTSTYNKLANQSLGDIKFNADLKTIDVTFDRDMDPATFDASDIIRIVGPFGTIFDAATSPDLGITVESLGAPNKTFRITFPDDLAVTFISGQYSIEIGSDIQSASGHLLDTNRNAGLFRLIGGDPGSAPSTLADTATYTTTDALNKVPGPGGKDFYPTPASGTISIPIDITDDYVIRQTTGRQPTDPHILVRMSLEHPQPSKVQAELVAPDGFRVRLFTGVGNAKTTLLQGFTGVFDDNATTPIQFLANELPTEPVVPQFPISAFAGHGSKGEWRLEITDKSNQAGKLYSWGLTLPFSNPVSFDDGVEFQGTPPPPRPGVPPVPMVNISNQPTGLGEPVADRFTIGFRVFNQDPLDPRTRQIWVPVGPTSMNGQTNEQNNAGRVSAVAVDPSDPSGNTVYVGAGTGGIWKTTNFLTTGDAGPVWEPLTDFGPIHGLAVSSILLVPRNGDPNQTVVYAMTGDGSRIVDAAGQSVASPTPGVGVLRSPDAGKTWQVLDSSKNVDGSGNLLAIDDPGRDRVFFNAQGFKIIADPAPSAPEEKILLYMAIGGTDVNSRGVWRSRDGGDTWVRIEDRFAATDVILAPNSAGSTGNLERLYAALEGNGGGVFTTVQAPSVPINGMTRLGGGTTQHDLIRDVTFPPATPGLPVGLSNTSFPATVGRISLSLPAPTDNPLQNTLYAGWLYALVSNPDGTMGGLFVTKDFGLTWTEVHLPFFQPASKLGDFKANQVAFGTNNDSRADYDIFDPRPLPNSTNPNGLPRAPQGNYSQAISVDPQNPNIVYIGGLGSSNGRTMPVGGSLRVDTTRINDPYAFVFWDNTGPTGGVRSATAGTAGTQSRADSTGPLSPLPPPAPPYPPATTEGALYRPDPDPNVFDFYFGTTRSSYDNFGSPFFTYPDNYEDFLNLYRDPDNPFLTPTTLRVFNVASINNNGHNVAWRPFAEILGFNGVDSFDKIASGLVSGANDVHEIVPYTDPLTGLTRYIYATDHGVFTGVADDKGELIHNIGFAESVTFSRNGNLQIAQFNSGAVQPSQLAADIAGAMFYGMSRDNGFPVSSRTILTSGDTNWNNPLENFPGSNDTMRYDPTGVWVETDPTGSGTAFEYRWPGTSGPGIQLPTDFFRVFGPNTDHSGEGVSQTKGLLQGDDPGNNQGQWKLGDELPGGKFALNPYDNKGLVIGSNSGQVFRTTNQSNFTWFSVGTPQPGSVAQALAFGAPVAAKAELNNFVFAGTTGGQIFITYDKATDAFTGAFTGSSNANVSAGLDGSPVVRIIPNPAINSREAFAITQKGVFYAKNVVDIAEGVSGAKWEDITGNVFGLVRPASQQFGSLGTTVVATNALQSLQALAVDWRVRLPFDPADEKSETYPPLYVAGEGGVFQTLDRGKSWAFYPDVKTDGATVDGGFLPNVKVTDLDLAIGPFDPLTGKFKSENSLNMLVATTYGRGTFVIRLPQDRQSGPRVVSVQNPTNPTSGPTSKIGVTFNQSIDVRTFDAADVTLLDTNGNPVNITKVYLATTPQPGQPDPQDKFWIEFDAQAAAGQYKLIVGPDIYDLSGTLMNQDADAANGEDPNSVMTPRLDDRFIQYVFFNGVADSLVISGLPSQVVAGESQTITISVLDKTGTLIPNYTGTVQISNTDATATSESKSFPVTFTFTTGDAGTADVQVTFFKAGVPFQTQTIVAISKSGPAINPGKIDTKVVAADPSQIVLTGFPSPVFAGEQHQFTVTAFDPFNNVADKYRGTATFSSSDTHPAVGLPPPYTFTAADAGSRTFDGTLATPGFQSITVTDAANKFASTQANIKVNPEAMSLSVYGFPSPITAGDLGLFFVEAKNRFGQTARTYTGTVTFETTDPNSKLPTTYTFTPADQGKRQFDAVLKTVGTHSITASDTATKALIGTQSDIVVAPSLAGSFKLTGLPVEVTAGQNSTYTISVLDASGLPSYGYVGTVVISSTDKQAVFPTTYTFQPTDYGVKTLPVQFRTAGGQSITVREAAGPATPGVISTTVLPAAASGFSVGGFPDPVTAGDTKSFTVKAVDPFGNVSTQYAGTIAFSSSDKQAALPVDGTLTNGVGTFAAILKTAGEQSITATDVANAKITGSQVGITVEPSAANQILVSKLPATVSAGEQFGFTVTMKDVFGNIATGFTGDVKFSSTDPQGVLPATYTFQAADKGVKAFTAEFRTAGPRNLSVTSPVGGVNPGAGSTVVIAGPATQFVTTSLPPSLTAGEAASFTVTAKDQFGNVADAFTGTLTFSSSDPQAIVPPPYTFVPATDKGSHAFGVTFFSAGDQTLTIATAGGTAPPTVLKTNVISSIATSFEVSADTTAVGAGGSVTITITARDQFGNVDAGYAGTVRFTSTDKQATLPPDSALTSGVGKFGVALRTAGDQTITVVATSDPSLTGMVPVTVSAGTATKFDLSGPTGTIVAGAPFLVDVTARDQFGNVAVGYAGSVQFTSTDPAGVLPPTGPLTAGTGRLAVILNTAGSQVVSAADTANPGVGGSLAAVNVVLPPPPPNAPPTVSDIADQTTRLNQAVGPIVFTIGDALSPAGDLTVTVATSDPTLFPESGIVLAGSGPDRTLTLTPAPGKSGTATVTVTVTDPGGLSATDVFAITVLPTTGPQPPVLIGSEQFSVGTDVGGSPTIRFFNPDGTERTSFIALSDPSFSGGVRTAASDFNGDGIADIVVGTGPGIATFVRVLDGQTQAELFSITPFEVSFTGGVYVAAGDLNGDGIAELVITPDQGGGPRVRVFDGTTFELMADFFGIDDPDFRGGARAAVGDITGDKVGDLIVSAGFLGGPRVAGYEGKSIGGVPIRVFADFFAFEDTLRNGVYLASGDIDGDGFAEVIAGGGPDGGPRVTAFSGKALLSSVLQPIANFFGGDPDNRGGIRLAVKDLDDDSQADLIVGSGEGAGARVTAYYGKDIGPAGTPSVAFDFDAFTRFNGGVFVG